MNATSIDFEKLSFTSHANGYTLTYGGQSIGGAGVLLPRHASLHWKHAQQNVKDFATSARRDIEALRAGKGPAHYLAAILAAQAPGTALLDSLGASSEQGDVDSGSIGPERPRGG